MNPKLSSLIKKTVEEFEQYINDYPYAQIGAYAVQTRIKSFLSTAQTEAWEAGRDEGYKEGARDGKDGMDDTNEVAYASGYEEGVRATMEVVEKIVEEYDHSNHDASCDDCIAQSAVRTAKSAIESLLPKSK